MKSILLALTFALLVFGTASAQSVGDTLRCIVLSVNNDGSWIEECQWSPVSEPTPQPTVAPTPTPDPDATPIAPFASAPKCTEHDVRAFHTLWNEQLGCHYDHHHGDNPHDVDDVLGTDYYAIAGGEISYPWQTLGADGTQPENDYKHAGYFWHVRRDMPCDTTPCITAFRVLVHQHQTGRDATVRYHSYVMEAATSDGGYFLFGGWADFGDLHSPEGTIIVNVPDNHDSFACGGAGRHKQHSPPGGPNHEIWYGASQQVVGECHPRGFVTVSVSGLPFDATDPADPAKHDDYTCWNPAQGADNTRCRINGTVLRPHSIGIEMIDRWDSLIDADGDGIVTWSGNADRYGRLLDAPCAELGTDCAPVIFSNLSAGQAYGSANSHTANGARIYDIYFCGSAKTLCSRTDAGSRSAGWNEPVP